jgi:hypothetical protein
MSTHKHLLIFISAVVLLQGPGCTKNTTTNNNINKDTLSAYTVHGIRDMKLSTDTATASSNIVVHYSDSAQQLVHLSVTGLPAGITIGNNFVTEGYPTFSTTLTLLDTNYLQPAIEGDYPILFNCTSATGQIKSYPFTLHITHPGDTCLSTYTGIFPSCNNGTNTFADTVTNDATIPNKIWFSNFNGEGIRVAAMVSNCQVLIPAQISAGKLISGGGKTMTGSRLKLNIKSGDRFYLVEMN